MGAWKGDAKLLAKRAEKDKAKQAAKEAKEQVGLPCNSLGE